MYTHMGGMSYVWATYAIDICGAMSHVHAYVQITPCVHAHQFESFLTFELFMLSWGVSPIQVV